MLMRMSGTPFKGALRATLLCSLLWSCSGGVDEDAGNPSADGGADAGMRMDLGPLGDAGTMEPSIEIGTGEESFITVTSGQSMDIARGRQAGGQFGGYHIVWALRFTNIDVGQLAELSLSLKTTADNVEQGRVALAPDLVPKLPNGMGGIDILARNTRLDDCCLAANRELSLSVRAVEMGGTVHEESIIVNSGSCIDEGVDICP